LLAGKPAPVTAPAQKSGFKDLEDKFEDWFNTAVSGKSTSGLHRGRCHHTGTAVAFYTSRKH
jgi:hypothetical protein